MEGIESWIGRTETATTRLDGWPLAGLMATLDLDAAVDDGAILPPTAHWLYFQPSAPQSMLGEDGHPQRGGFLPPIELPRRMWAASEIAYHLPLRVGDVIEKRSCIADVSVKQGRSGTLAFVTVTHDYVRNGTVLLSEAQKLVYRDAPAPGEPAPPPQPTPEGGLWSHPATPDSRMLFRYSAVTFNAHRIHYDAPYAVEIEGYPGIVVHGQLTATLLIHALIKEKPEMRIGSYAFRAVRPIFAGTPIRLEGKADGNGFRLWARDETGALCVEGQVRP
ncbi:MaoC family dehydratase N-terminal domain-containing protein [Bosea sp. 117]|uniref:FAS1-like dehydratase domain-containing protein n=1 Tax=Bosea sp. 117 TaxID=1125973 RepID=UPI000493FCC2|nr:MaoC family dehydratase N-terminal domain-containing protein [Bosea sp. 117]